MNTTMIVMVLTALLSALQSLGVNSQTVANVINLLIAIVPTLVKEYEDAVPIVKNIISLLKSSGQLTDEQMAELDTQEAKIDADWEKASADYDANHPDTP